MDWEFLLSALAGGGVTAALLAIAGYLGRAQLAHWLNKDIEQIKARHQQDLEAYKVSLIAEAERAKSVQDLKRAGAMKVLEMELEALKEFQAAKRAIAVDYVALAQMSATYKNVQRFSEMAARHEALKAAAFNLDVFLDFEQQKSVSTFRQLLFQVLPRCQPGVAPYDDQELATVQHGLYSASLEVDALFNARVVALRSLE